MKGELTNKVVVITGASLGIGRATALYFAKAQAKLVLTYFQDETEALATAKQALALGAKDAFVVHLNLLDDESILQASEIISDRYRSVDILINNAGAIVWKPLREQSFEEIALQLRTNLEGLIKFTKTMLPYIRDTIINIASSAGKKGFADLTTYCASKFGVRGFTQALAKEIPYLTLFSINPGMTATRMTNFQGRAPEEVAQVIYNAAINAYKMPSGSDIDVGEILGPWKK